MPAPIDFRNARGNERFLKPSPDTSWRCFSFAAPEGFVPGHFGDRREKFTRILTHSRDVVGFKPLFKHIQGKKPDYIRERDDALFRCGIEPGPAPDVLFRPEEVHGASGIGKPLHPL